MLKGQRLSLRAIECGDLSRYVTWLNAPEVTDHLKTFLPFYFNDESDWYEAPCKVAPVAAFWWKKAD